MLVSTASLLSAVVNFAINDSSRDQTGGQVVIGEKARASVYRKEAARKVFPKLCVVVRRTAHDTKNLERLVVE